MIHDSILQARKYLTLKSHKPGAIKIKVSLGILSSPAAKELEGFTEMPKGVKKIDKSLLSQTLTIDYDPDVIKPELLEQLIAGDDQQAEAAAEQLRDVFEA